MCDELKERSETDSMITVGSQTGGDGMGVFQEKVTTIRLNLQGV